MQFLMMYTPEQQNGECGPQTQEQGEAMGRLIEEETKAGRLLLTGGLRPISQGARVTRSEGKLSVTDGPYVETKELVGGFAIFRLPSKEAAVESAKQFLQLAGDGQVEIRPLDGMS
jgi:hypothetical protein